MQADLKGRQHELEKKLKAQYGFWYQLYQQLPNPTKALFTPKKGNKPSIWRSKVEQGDRRGDLGAGRRPATGDQLKTRGRALMPRSNERTVQGYPCTKIKRVEFNPGSRDHIARVLKLQGWEPTKLTEGGKPQIDEEVIESIAALLGFPRWTASVI